MMTLFKNAALAVVLAAGTLSTTACTTDNYGDQHLSRPGKGALIGAAGGAVVGALTGNALAGAAIGAAGGAIVGVIADDHHRYEDRDGRRYYYDDNNRRYHYNERREREWDRPPY